MTSEVLWNGPVILRHGEGQGEGGSLPRSGNEGLGWRREAAFDAERSQGRARLESREEAHPGKARCGDSLAPHSNGRSRSRVVPEPPAG